MNCIPMNIMSGRVAATAERSQFAQSYVGKIVVAVLTSKACQEGCYVC